ncbi:transmembrane protein [Scheffersomyces coipomensis]|uniref:uncharacterized protein n=1 Tax=Scheffersomyces coipomensis TaxID=1788519 RepID=UPI00315C4C9B
MANNSLLYLQENDIPINCSIYSLPYGFISFMDSDNNNTWSNLTTGFLPAYYITNCSIPLLVDLVTNSNITYTNSTSLDNSSPYNQKDNGDTFVALLFTLSGSCVSSWMLTLLFYLSPKHKRKPILTQLATLFYSIVTTILLSKVTGVASDEYYSDTLDVIRLHDIIYLDDVYRGTMIVSQVLILLGWFQIVLKISRQKYQWRIGIVGVGLIIAYTVVNIVYETKYYVFDSVFENSSINFEAWTVAKVVLKLLLIAWFSATLLYYTIYIKNPRNICYSKRLMPIAIFNWCIIILHVILSILGLTLFKGKWLVKTWLTFLPFLLEIILLSTIWEWVYNIRLLEKRMELMGVLGRRISFDDVLSLHSDKQHGPKVLSNSGGFSFFNNLFRRNQKIVTQDDTDNSVELKEIPTTSNESSRNDSNNNNNTETTLTVNIADSNIHSNTPQGLTVNNNNNNNNNDIHPTSSAGSYDDEYIDNYNIWDDDEEDENETGAQHHHDNDASHQPVEGSSSNAPPPPFEVHPGFNSGDYWNDRKN